MRCICNACANDSPCIIDGGEGSGEPVFCPYCGSLYEVAEWKEIEDVPT